MGEDQYVVTVGLPELDGLLRGLNKNARSACLCVSNGGGGHINISSSHMNNII